MIRDSAVVIWKEAVVDEDCNTRVFRLDAGSGRGVLVVTTRSLY